MKKELIDLLACPICKSTTLYLNIFKEDENEVIDGELKCIECGKVYSITDGIPYMIPQELSKDWETKQNLLIKDIENYYNTLSSQKIKEKYELMRKGHQHFMNFVDTKGGKLLDIGCGDGQKGDFLTNTKYYGIDPFVRNKQYYIQSTLKLTYRYPFICGFGEYLPFRDEVFDYVVIMASLDHVDDPTKVIAESYRVLKPLGSLCVSVGIEEKTTLITLFKIAFGLIRNHGIFHFFRQSLSYAKGYHLRNYTRETLISDFNPKIFKLVNEKYFDRQIFLKVKKISKEK